MIHSVLWTVLGFACFYGVAYCLSRALLEVSDLLDEGPCPPVEKRPQYPSVVTRDERRQLAEEARSRGGVRC
jgi:hypothetical protein